MSNARCFKLSPSDLTFQWDECRHCFYQKIVMGVRDPQMPMPKIFTEIHAGLKTWSDGKRTELIARGVPKGVIEYSEKWVQSSVIKLNGGTAACFISGRFDTVANLDGGGYAVVDFKTARRNENHLEIYGRQLHAYAYALEHPGPGKWLSVR